MAQVPCCFCERRYVGKPVTAYNSWQENGRRITWIQKACPACSVHGWDMLFANKVAVYDGYENLPLDCPACKNPLDHSQHMFFVTFFRGDDRKDVMASLCPNCAVELRNMLTKNAILHPKSQAELDGASSAPVADNRQAADSGGLPW